MKIVAALLAGTGVYEMAERIIQRLVDDPLVERLYVRFPEDRHGGQDVLFGEKVFCINGWRGEDSHDKTGINREEMRSLIYSNWSGKADWAWFGDEDAMPAHDYFQVLSELHYDEPVLLTGKTFNTDGRRWYDICSFQTDGYPFCVPYDDWDNPRWAKDLYCSGNQHVMNRAGFLLDVPYPDIPGEDPHYCWAFRKAGGRLLFEPRLSMQLLKTHPHANHGYPPCLPPVIAGGQLPIL